MEGRVGLNPSERAELCAIADRRIGHPATKRVAELIYLALDVLERSDCDAERAKAAEVREKTLREALKRVIEASLDFSAPNWYIAVHRIEEIARAALSLEHPEAT